MSPPDLPTLTARLYAVEHTDRKSRKGGPFGLPSIADCYFLIPKCYLLFFQLLLKMVRCLQSHTLR